MNKEIKEQQINLLLLLATFKSFNEQLYNLKGTHQREIKQHFNMLVKVANRYEKRLDANWLKDNKKAVDQLYDALTDLIYMLREGVEKQSKKPVKKKTNAKR